MPKPPINRDTQVCISLASRPSNLGTRFHNYLYEELGLDFFYKAMTTTDIATAIGGVRSLGIRGASISMPFKEAVIELVDELDVSAAAIDSVNTIVNTAGRLTAYNTDYGAVRQLLLEHQIDPALSVLLRGSGGMAKAVGAAFRDLGFANGTLWARNASTGQKLAGELGFDWHQDASTQTADVLVNVTPIGMRGPDETALAFSREQVAASRLVFDLVAFPAETPLLEMARAAQKPVLTGVEVIALQAAAQFELYTGVRPTDSQVAAASEYSRLS